MKIGSRQWLDLQNRKYKPFKNEWDMKNYFFIDKVNKIVECNRCGMCCEYSYVYITEEEIINLSTNLGISNFKTDYLIEICNGIWSFKQHPCPFYKQGCTIYEFRPWSCKIYPFYSVILNKNINKCKAVEWFSANKELVLEFKIINENAEKFKARRYKEIDENFSELCKKSI